MEWQVMLSPSQREAATSGYELAGVWGIVVTVAALRPYFIWTTIAVVRSRRCQRPR